MELRASMIQFALGQAGVEVDVRGGAEAAIERVRLLRSKALVPGTLYVCAGKPLRTVPKSSGAGLLVGDGEALDAVELLERACDVVRTLDRWDSELEAALSEGVSLGAYIRLGERMIPYAFAFYDRDGISFGASGNFAEQALRGTDGVDWPDDVGEGAVPARLLTDLFEDDEYWAAARNEQPFYFRSMGDGWHAVSYCLNSFEAGDYAARLVVTLPEGMGELHRGAELIVAHFFGYLDRKFKLLLGSKALQGNRGDALHMMLRGLLLEGGGVERSGLTGAAASYGWSRAHRYALVKFVFFESVKWDSAAEFICRQLERQWPATCAVHAARSILWLVNVDLSGGDSSEPALHSAVADCVRTYACKAGVSDILVDYIKVATLHAQAEAALSIGQARHPHWWYHRFEDCKMGYLLSKATEEFEPAEMASRKVLALAEADRESGSEYVRTLRVYLDCKQSATRAAAELFVHRTSLLRRIERIQSLTGIDLDDPDEVLYLGISLRLLEQA